MNILKQSTAATIKLGIFVDDTDGKTPETGLTISQADIRLSKNGGDFAQTHNAAGATHDENGYYDVPLDTTDTDTLGRLKVAVLESGALPVWEIFEVLPANVFDSLVAGGDKLDVTIYDMATDSITAASVKADAVTKIQTGLATSTALATVDGIVDDILEDTGTTLPAQISGVSAPTAAAVADAVLDELLSGHATAGSLSKAITDILEDTGTTLPGQLTANTLVKVTGPVVSGGDLLLIPGDVYDADDSRQLEWTSTAWPNLTGATVTFTASNGVTKAMSVITAGGSGTTQKIRLELTAAESLSLEGRFSFTVKAALQISGNVVTLVRAHGECDD